MNQPTEDRLKHLEAEQKQLKEQVQRIEQATEPINVRIERGLPVPEAQLLQTLVTMAGTNATEMALLKGEMLEVRADITAIRESQADFRDTLEEVRSTLATTVASKGNIDAVDTRVHVVEQIQQEHGGMLREILARLPEKDK
ncbi:MAG TPA: hypothetical protein VHV10_02175 [Ktedonobacteraceae bacterium]|jgi:hypothetical protein|nr:hypothetical protein [Ktedonobacteraceae bacterium]